MGQVALGGRGDAAGHQGHPGRPPRARPDLAAARRARPADRASQLHLDAALFPGLVDLWDNIFLGRLAVAPVGRDAVHRLGDRRRHHGPLSPTCGSARLNAASAGCRSGAGGWTSSTPMSAAPRQLKMKPSEYLTSGRYFCSVERHEGDDMFDMVTQLPRRRRPDVRLRLSALGMPVPGDGRELPGLADEARAARQADGRQRRPLLQADLA